MSPASRRRSSKAARAAPMVGCAGWVIPQLATDRFPESGSHLERYAATFTAVEINSSFYRSHRAATYARWAASVPRGFRFSVKAPRNITHVLKLRDATEELEAFISEVEHLGAKLGCLLVQFPPSLDFNRRSATEFFAVLRDRFDGAVACEPRHHSWFDPNGNDLLADFRVARIVADPPLVPSATEPGGWNGLRYYRLHGAPRMYYSAYQASYLDRLAARLAEAGATGVPSWCIFDNTAAGAAALDALALIERLQRRATGGLESQHDSSSRSDLPIHLVQMLLPIYDNEGRLFAHELFRLVSSELTERFGGLTAYTRAPAEGLWKEDAQETTREDVVVWEIMANELDRKWWLDYRRRLEKRFRQEHIVIRTQEMHML
ncbi:MAG: DUF72 domain-containing protein [Gemmatimonadaceae bacterium]